jgi:hypothetical protein
MLATVAELTIRDLDRYEDPHRCVARAQQYLLSARKSAAQALAAMKDLREKRKEEQGLLPGGRTSDQDQDLLRAMLVFSCAGVDAAMKALIEDALPDLADMDPAVQGKLDQFAERYLADGGAVSSKSLARVLGHAGSPRQALVQQFIQDLTGGSLQSSEQLQTVSGALGVTDPDLRRGADELNAVFRARNQIIHELDLTAEGWFNRRQRAMRHMVDMANDALNVAQGIINSVCENLWEAEDVAASGTTQESP